MLQPESFTGELRELGYSFFTGVPDSLLKELCACITDTFDSSKHTIAANEGGAVALAAGYHLATGEAAVVYMQNSGVGNAVNPLLSLADPDVYSIPMLVVVGWRGEPGVKDEPQHVKQGRVQEQLLSALGYEYEVLSADAEEAQSQLQRLTEVMKSKQTPVVLLVRKDTFDKYASLNSATDTYPMTREEALTVVLESISAEDRVVSTTGKTSREIYELREARGEGQGRDFLTVGSMGHSVMIALGLARFQKRRIVCIDGDGAALMHLGSMALNARLAPASFLHVLINNGAHESVGGQPTIGYELDFPAVAQSLGYKTAASVSAPNELRRVLTGAGKNPGPTLVEIRVKQGSRADLGRPKTTPVENKQAFCKLL